MATIGCVCPPKADGTPRHVTDEVTFREKMPFVGGQAARFEMSVLLNDDADASPAERMAVMGPIFLFYGIESWTLRDKQNHEVPVSRQAIRALMEEHDVEASDLVQEATQLYMEAVINPLRDRESSSSPPTSTNGSTSATTGSSPTPPKRPKPSSISTIPTAGTEKMSASPGGGYSS
jgi:hypothetical protein